MEVIRENTVLLELFKELNSGGLDGYEDDDQALVLRLESNGGPKEDSTFFLKFNYVEYFQLPLGLDAPRINGCTIDEIRIVSEDEARELMPKCCYETVNYKKSDYRCFRFYADNHPSPFYIYCLGIEGRVE